MADLPDFSQLVNSAQLARRFGLASRQSIIKWRARWPDMPPPRVEEGKAMFWWWPEVRDWGTENGLLLNLDGVLAKVGVDYLPNDAPRPSVELEGQDPLWPARWIDDWLARRP